MFKIRENSKGFPFGGGGGGSLESKPHLVKWAIVCSDKINEGLRVRCFYYLNKALLCKWNWHFATERDVFWRDYL